MIDLDKIQPELPVVSVENGLIETSVKTVSSDSSVTDPETKTPSQNSLEMELKLWKEKCSVMAAERELALALSGESLLPGVAPQLMKLWQDRIVAVADDKLGFQVKSSDGRALAEAVKDWLLSPDFQHFRTAGYKGGTATRTESAATQRSVSGTTPIQTLNESVIHQWRQRAQRAQSTTPAGYWPS